MYVGHVDGKTFDEVDPAKPDTREKYIELGHKLLNYLPYCYKNGLYYLTDMMKADQFLYIEQPDGSGEFVMVDLELHHSKSEYRDQIDQFLDCFIKPLEQRTGRSAWELRAHRWQIIKNAPGAGEYPAYTD